MIVQIRVRGENGQYRNAYAGEFSEAALRKIVNYGKPGDGDGWYFLRIWLCKVCLRFADWNSEDPTAADRWIRRYQAIRGIE